jgi:hypothetical protein
MAHERDDKNGSGGQDWFLRRGGVVLGASFDVQAKDEVRFTRANAYLKCAYGQHLTHCQSAWKTDPGSASKTDPFGAGVCSRPAA